MGFFFFLYYQAHGRYTPFKNRHLGKAYELRPTR